MFLYLFRCKFWIWSWIILFPISHIISYMFFIVLLPFFRLLIHFLFIFLIIIFTILLYICRFNFNHCDAFTIYISFNIYNKKKYNNQTGTTVKSNVIPSILELTTGVPSNSTHIYNYLGIFPTVYYYVFLSTNSCEVLHIP